MGTRCNIWVDNGTKVVQYYHHWDGYPEGVGDELVTMAKMCLIQTPHEYSNGETTVNVDVLTKNYLNLVASVPDNQYEPEGEVLDTHGDIEYLYYVKLYKNGIDVLYSGCYDGGFLNLDDFRAGKGKSLF